MSGEITFNHETRPFFVDEQRGELVLRGGHVQRYALIKDPKQGKPVYLDSKAYLAKSRRYKPGTGELTKAYHHEKERIVFQESAALDNWRWIIATHLPAGQFCGHKVAYFVDVKWDLWVLLAIFNSKVVEWRFRIVSATNSLSAYQLGAIPVPVFTRIGMGRDDAEVSEVKVLYRDGQFDACLRLIRDYVVVGKSDVVYDTLGFLAKEMVELNARRIVVEDEFLEWLQVYTGLSLDAWEGISVVRDYARSGWDAFRVVLDRNSLQIRVDVAAEIVRFKKNYDASVLAVGGLRDHIGKTDWLIDRVVYCLYRLSEGDISLIEDRLAKVGRESPVVADDRDEDSNLSGVS